MPRRKSVEDVEMALPPKRKKTAAFLAVLVVLCVAVTTGAILVGTSDKGQINVSGVIQTSNQERIDAGQEPLTTEGVTADNFKNMPNGGLVAKEDQSAQTPPPQATDTQATSTEEGDTDADAEVDTSTNTQTDTALEGADASEASESVAP